MKQTYKKITVAFVIFTMAVAMYGVVPHPSVVNAADSITNASDTISDSDLGVTADHLFQFTTTATTTVNEYVEIQFPAGVFEAMNGGDVTINCAAGGGSWNAATTPDADTVRCSANAQNDPGVYQIAVNGVDNPMTEASQMIEIFHMNAAGDTVVESVQVVIAIVNDISVTAKVNASMTFTVDGMTDAETVNTVNCSLDTTATTTDFDVLTPFTPVTLCQELTVATNATEGYIVTVEQDQELTSDGGATINSFVDSPDGTGSSTVLNAWQSPGEVLDQYNSYGHMGLTSDDEDLTTQGHLDFYNGGSPLYAGLNDTDVMVIMDHTGPALGVNQNAGLAHVAYTAEISNLQEAGDYESTLTYIATPTF